MLKDRREAGRRLADRLLHHLGDRLMVLAVPRGGVVVGYEIASRLKAELDVIVPRKLGSPGNPELAIGAVMHDGTTVYNREIIEQLGVPEGYIKDEIRRQVMEIERRLERYRGGRSYGSLSGYKVILVDDGVATGATLFTAIEWVKRQKPRSLIVAIPVGPPATVKSIEALVDEVVCLITHEPFFAISEFYEDFHQIEDDEVIALLRGGRRG